MKKNTLSSLEFRKPGVSARRSFKGMWLQWSKQRTILFILFTPTMMLVFWLIRVVEIPVAIGLAFVAALAGSHYLNRFQSANEAQKSRIEKS
jgi:hypothetical protein